MVLYVDPGTGGAIFQGAAALLAALGGGVALVLACLLRPVRSFFRAAWQLVRRLARSRGPAEQSRCAGESVNHARRDPP